MGLSRKLAQLIDSSGNVLASKLVNAQAFPSGTLMLFLQTAAPTGWTKSTTHNDKALRIVSGTVSSGGSASFSSAFASQTPSGSLSSTTATGTIGSTTLSAAQIPSHNHLGGFPRAAGYGYANSLYGTADSGTYGVSSEAGGVYTGRFAYTSSTGSSGAHNHSLAMDAHGHTFTGNAINLAVQYVDAIIATKD